MTTKTTPQPGNRRPIQLRAERKDGFTAEKRQVFLDHLAGCCNVTRAAAVVGFTPVTINYHRRRDPAFAEACAEALEAGYVALEASLLERAARGGGYEPGAGAGDAPGPETLDVGLAQFLIGLRAREAGRRTGHTSGPRPRRATEKELDELILAKLALLDQRMRAEKAGRRSKGK